MNLDAPSAHSEPTEPAADVAAEVMVIRLPADDVAPGLARREIATHWGSLPEPVLEDVLLIVSELVTNAVRHGKPDIEMRLRIAPYAIDVSVLDHGETLPPADPSAPPGTAVSGRGLRIVDLLSNRWGVDPLPDSPGKAVWASLRTDTD